MSCCCDWWCWLMLFWYGGAWVVAGGIGCRLAREVCMGVVEPVLYPRRWCRAASRAKFVVTEPQVHPRVYFCLRRIWWRAGEDGVGIVGVDQGGPVLRCT